VNDEVAPAGDLLGDQFGGFSGGEVSELLAHVAAHYPVVEAVVRNNMNSGGCHRLNSMRGATFARTSPMAR
jgi:hypothetical protein